MAQKENPVCDLLIEASPAASALILKRRKLFRAGGSVYVGELRKIEKKSWLKASIAVASSDRNAWDLAHEVASRYKKELGQLPYIEPDRAGGRYDRLVNGYQPAASDDPFGLANAAAMVPDPMAAVRAMLPDIPFQPQSFGVGIGAGIGRSPFPGFGQSQPGFGGGFNHRPMDAASQALKLLNDSAREAGGEVSVPALHELPGWSDLPASTAKMFEVESLELLRKYSGGHLVYEQHTAESLMGVAQMQDCSKRLRAFVLQR